MDEQKERTRADIISSMSISIHCASPFPPFATMAASLFAFSASAAASIALLVLPAPACI